MVATAAAIVTFLPRLTVEAAGPADLTSPFPHSIVITNGVLPLKNVSFFIRPCIVRSSDYSTIIGRTGSCDGLSPNSNFSLHRPDWENHQLRMDEKWTITGIGAPIRVLPKLDSADISILISYWPQFIPQLWFADRQIEVRLSTAKQPDGSIVWVYRPIN